MPSRARPAMYNTPAIRNGGFGALQVEAITNRPLSIARRHYAASQLRMRDIEPDELSSSEWVRFLVMEEQERERWMTQFVRRRRNSDESTSSAEQDRDAQYNKAEEARLEAEEVRRPVTAEASAVPTLGQTPAVSLWSRQFDGREDNSRDVHRTTTYACKASCHRCRIRCAACVQHRDKSKDTTACV